jgi:soluble lytic murein transglycosylase-like protein
MQIMPETWSDLRRRYGLGTDPYDAHDNIIAGAAYLRIPAIADRDSD